MAKVELKDVWKIFPGDVTAVREATFTIEDGEFMVVVGPSGCGKSTTLRMVAGLEDISRGTVSIDGRVVNDVAPKDRDIAMVFQNYALYPHMTVYDNMAFGLKMRKYAKAEIDARVREGAEILGLTEYLERKPKALSGGQRQRVAVGRAIVRKPKVFLFDEPLSNLDAKLRAQTRKEIARLHRQLGATMIYVTHDQVEAMTLGDRIVVMDRGYVQQIAPPLELYERPLNRFVAGFIGSPAMNFVDGRLVRENGVHFVSTDGRIRFVVNDVPANAAAFVTAGIRPEHLRLAPAGDERAVAATLDVVEPMGNELILYARTEGHELVARVPPVRPPEPGTTVHLTVDSDQAHLFDGESGVTLR
jgi:multiple sugar transport system ATP-binding protein